MSLVLVLTRADPISDWLEKKHKGGCKARPTLGIAAITILTGCWIQACDSSKHDVGNLFSCRNRFKQESLMAINLWETIFGWMNVSEWGTGKKIPLTEKNESETGRQTFLQKLKSVLQKESTYSAELLLICSTNLWKPCRAAFHLPLLSCLCKNRAIKWSHTKKGSEEARRGSSLKYLGKFWLFKICIV